MKYEELIKLSDHELLKEANKMKSSAITHAFMIGFLFAIIIYSVVKNSWGFVSLIPLYLIYHLSRKPLHDTDLKKVLKERNLK